ncbi:MAG TPA: MarR family transcriptional regulator [Candidatus Ruania gallistercoris]|uniref:MarR family transcriptional regulator n=1 Tax=Candidatus Ruania gallistercoris TaxID=2838746 RepID=A0A9D2EEZ0_9MICO|nr:MarR family transcriptional regulator [Candidatus Ruania gallistercoris]
MASERVDSAAGGDPAGIRRTRSGGREAPPGTGKGAPRPPGGLASRLRLTLLRTARKLRAERAGRLSETQHAVISAVVAHGPFTPSALAAREHVRPPSMTRTIQALESEGLLQRTEHPEDRRQVLVTSTEAGREYVAETRRRRDKWLSRRLAALTPEERQVLSQAEEILRRITTQ